MNKRFSLGKCPETGKPCYDKKSAASARNHRFKQDHVQLRIYQCPFCNLWHLTKQPRSERWLKGKYGE